MTQLPKLLTPSSQGFFMPAEWEQHYSTWLAWPHNLETWTPNDLREVENVYIKIIHNLITGERINILIENKSFQKRIISLLTPSGLNTKQISFHEILTNDAWIRDFGPNFIVKKLSSGRQIAINLWQFNSWGEKYPWQKDNEVSNKIISESKITCFNPKIVLEGGSIDVNGKGTCLTTSTCLLNLNRNGNLTVEEIEKYLKSYLGVKKIIWLKGILKGDDTDGHIDNLARFTDHTTIVYISEKDENNENFMNLKGIEGSLKKARGPNGKPFLLIPLPMPRKIKDNNFYLPASYANFYIGNNAVLLPAFNDPNDKVAQNILQSCFPRKKIVPIDSRILIKGLGGIHCITQQQPMYTE